jgi:transposase
MPKTHETSEPKTRDRRAVCAEYHYAHGMTARDVAAAMKVDVRTVKRWFAKALSDPGPEGDRLRDLVSKRRKSTATPTRETTHHVRSDPQTPGRDPPKTNPGSTGFR